jgi:hypothetical protein
MKFFRNNFHRCVRFLCSVKLKRQYTDNTNLRKSFITMRKTSLLTVQGNIQSLCGVTNVMIRRNNLLSFRKFLTCILLMIAMPLSGQVLPDSGKQLSDIVLFAEGSGFIPFSESFRINYQTSLAGLPIEVAGGICFPINSALSGMFEFRYKRRTAVFVPNFRIKTLEIELGVRDYLEKKHEGDLRLYGSAGLLLAESTAAGNIDARSSDGTSIGTIEVSQDYFNIGLGLGLGVEYPLTNVSGLYFGIHLGVYFSDPVATGGLGNVGGLSFGLGYKIELGN